MAILLKCGKCGKALQARDELAGKRVKCPGCGTVLAVPAPRAPSPLEAALALETPETAPAPAPAPAPRPAAAVKPAAAPKPAPKAAAGSAPAGKSKTGLIIGIVAALLVVSLIAAGKGALLVPIIVLAFFVLPIAGMWKVFVKADQPGWAAIVPIYNVYVLLEVAGKPMWWLILFFVPFVSIIAAILVHFAVAKNFGKSALFAIGLILLPFIFYPILGFGRSQYGGE